MTGHGLQAPSPWVTRWAHLIPAGAAVLDVACGAGRHSRFLSQRGHPVAAVDRDAEAIAAVAPFCEAVCADIEDGPWPFAGRRFAAVLVTNYLWRPLVPTLLDSLLPAGVLIYETFAAGNETVGKPSRPDFLLQPGELLTLCAGLRIVAYEDGFLDAPPRFVQRAVALRPPAEVAAGPARHAL
ncbi:MAG: class I SAM-dependent methyltransferase [Curvibacter sp.]|nr:class I SAM-dependent methyltransferase [Curvibacter sp.]